MALGKFALTELLDAIRAGGSMDAIRESLEFVLQALIELEAAIKIAPGATNVAMTAPLIATAAARGCCPPRPGM